MSNMNIVIIAGLLAIVCAGVVYHLDVNTRVRVPVPEVLMIICVAVVVVCALLAIPIPIYDARINDCVRLFVQYTREQCEWIVNNKVRP